MSVDRQGDGNDVRHEDVQLQMPDEVKDAVSHALRFAKNAALRRAPGRFLVSGCQLSSPSSPSLQKSQPANFKGSAPTSALPPTTSHALLPLSP